LILEVGMSRNSFVISIQPIYRCRMNCFEYRNMATRIHKSKRHSKKKDKQEFKKFLREGYGL
jgi:hypothetical protein